MSDGSPPLAGIRVLDLTRLLPGPLATLHLADLGADVIKIEDPDHGDYARWMGPLKKTQSGWFIAINRNKRSVTLNLKSVAGVDAFIDLVNTADVIIESFRPGVMDKLGIGYNTLSAANPAVVMCSISGYGQTGPDRLKSGHDINYCAQTGILEQSGARGGPPAPGNFQVADIAGGAQAAVMGVMAALISVGRGGPGRFVDIAMADCAAASGIMAMMELEAHGQTRPRGDGFLTGQLPNYAVYETRDHRYMAVGALEHKFWQLLCVTLGANELAELDLTSDEQCEQGRKRVADIFASQTQAHWTELLAGVDCCTGPVLTLAEAMQDQQLKSRGLFFTEDHPTEGRVTQYACPVKMTDFAFSVNRPAPALGEHTTEIFQDLGYPNDRIQSIVPQN